MRTVVVGASSGLGRCIGVGLAQRGARTALLARRRQRLEGAAEEAGEGTLAITCDVTSTESCQSAVAEAAEGLGGIDALVYAPGIGPLVRLADMDADTWRQVFDTNVIGASLVTAAALPHLSVSSGNAVYLSSVSASVTPPWPGLGAYAVSKAALDKLVEAWRGEHPTVGFTRVIVGECMGGEGDSVPGFADGWDQELAAEVMPGWLERNYMSGTFVGIENLIGVVDSVLRQDGAHIASVTVAGRDTPRELSATGSGMHVEAYPYTARAWWDDQLAAQSDSCLIAEAPGELPVLWFPRADVDVDGMTGVSDHLLPTARGELDDYVAFDQERVRVEVTDEAAGDEPRDVTLKRFPTWGDATHLVDMMDVRPTDDRTLSFVTVARSDERRPVVEGSQMLGQAIVAAGRHAPDRRVVSASMIFLRAADARQPLRVELEELSGGRTFSGLAVQVFQGARCCAAGTVLLDVPSDDVVRHAADGPDAAGPYECEPYDMGVTGRDIRVVDGAYTNAPDAPPGPPTVDAWVRFRALPDDPALHAGLLAQFTGHMSIAAALRPHAGVSQDQAHFTLSMAINSISLSLHAPVKADDWLLYRHHSTFAGAGTTHAENRVYDLDGALVASFSVDAMVRPLRQGAKGPMDARDRAVSLTTGRGPLSATPAGRFTAAMPENVSYIEPFRRRVRATTDGRTVIDTERALLMHRPGEPPTFAFRAGDVDGIAVDDAADAPGYVTVPWHAVDAWFEEDEPLFGHPRNPYHRVDCLRSHRALRVEAAGATLVDTTETMVVYETALEPRLYVDPRFVLAELTRSQLQTYCPYKGTATYWNVHVDGIVLPDVAWSYEDALPESAPLQHLVSFDDQRVTVVHDLPAAD